jgi:DHA1 family inner membrane transport protein
MTSAHHLHHPPAGSPRALRRLDRRSRPQTASSGVTLAAIAAAAFVLGTAELVVVGVLDLVAADFHVSVARAGLLVTAYAAGISVGGPVLAALTLRFGRTAVMRAALAAYLAGNLVAVAATTFEMVLIARVATGALHGLFIGAAFAVAASVVPRERMGRAISAVFGGIAVSAAVGVPLGTLVGQTFGWQATFVAVVAMGTVAMAAAVGLVPDVAQPGSSGTRAQARHALAPRVLAILAIGFLLMGGQFAGLTYLATYLSEITGVSGAMTTIFLLCFGVANAVGTMFGGREADRDAAGTLLRANLILVAALAVLSVTDATPILTAVALAAWGLVGFGLVPSLQHRVVHARRSRSRAGSRFAGLGGDRRHRRRLAGRRLGGRQRRPGPDRPGCADLRRRAACHLGRRPPPLTRPEPRAVTGGLTQRPTNHRVRSPACSPTAGPTAASPSPISTRRGASTATCSGCAPPRSTA